YAHGTRLHSWIDSLSSGSVHACCHACDEAEGRKFKLFHKVLRQLNITNISLLQALTETRSNYSGIGLIICSPRIISDCELQSAIYTLKSSGVLAQLVERLNGINGRAIFSNYSDAL